MPDFGGGRSPIPPWRLLLPGLQEPVELVHYLPGKGAI